MRIHALMIVSLLMGGCSSLVKIYKPPEARVDSRPTMAIMTTKLRPLVQPSLWSQILDDPEIDELLPLANDRYLVGLTGVDVTQLGALAAFRPRYGQLLCVDGHTGNVLWRVDRKSAYDASYTILSTEPSILVERIEKNSREISLSTPIQVHIAGRFIPIRKLGS